MRKNVITKIMTLVLAATMALTPVTASAAEKTVITKDQFNAYYDAACDDAGVSEDDLITIDALNNYYNSVAAMDGCYQENGYKIYTALNGKTVTFKKTGNYSVIVGGKSAEKDQGSFKFVAPKTGTYKFTFTTKNNVAGDQICIDWDGGKAMGFDVKYKRDSRKISHSTYVLVTNNSKSVAYGVLGRGLSRYEDGNLTSTMTKVSGSIKLKKGQFVKYVARDCGASYDEIDEAAYNFTGFDVQITKTK